MAKAIKAPIFETVQFSGDSTKSLKESGETVVLLTLYKNAGRHEGEDCDLVRVRLSSGKKIVIERPLIEES